MTSSGGGQAAVHPLEFIATMFPRRDGWRTVIEQRVTEVGLLVPSSTSTSRQLGLAIEYAIGFDTCTQPYRRKLASLPDTHRDWVTASAISDGPTPPGRVDALLRAAYYMASVDHLLFAVVERGSDPATIAHAIDRGYRHPADSVNSFDKASQGELLALWNLYERTARADILQLGPATAAPGLHRRTGTHGAHIAAIADLIAGTTLIEIKARVVTQASDWLHTTAGQLIRYGLLAHSLYRVSTVGLYLARYGLLLTWPLSDLADQLAGHPVDLENVGTRLHVL